MDSPINCPSWHSLSAALDGSTRKSGDIPHALRNHTKRSNTVIFTSLSRYYMPKARIFAESLKRFHPDWEYHILVNDSWPADEGSLFPNVDLIVPIRQLPLDRAHSWIFGMDAEELCCAARPFYFKELLRAGYENVFFFDPDIQIFSSLNPLIEMLDTHSVLLTPHMDKPAVSDAEILYSELSVLAHGVFNLGFLGTRNTPDAHKVIDFWKHRLTRYSLKEHARGLWTDQKWFNLVPVYFDGVKVVHHQGCNVASWNISNRPISKRNGKLFAGEDELLFFHFSGFDKGVPKRMYQIFRAYSPALEELFSGYTLRHAHYVDDTRNYLMPWAFGKFDNGVDITWAIRRYYRDTLDHRLIFTEPFYSNATPSFYDKVQNLGVDYIKNEYDPPGRLRRHFEGRLPQRSTS